MAVTLDDLKHIAALARLDLPADRAEPLVAELNTILQHMEALSRADTAGIDPVTGIGAAGMPLQQDAGPSVKLQHPLADFAPALRDGFLLVPRLSTHETAEES
jgi:aspartyl-tRNA(Asn)/glutamyl-tRNA(Gln) amidotransferase subunit C